MTVAKSRGGQRTTENGQFDGMAHESRHARTARVTQRVQPGTKRPLGKSAKNKAMELQPSACTHGAQDPQERGRTQYDGEHIARGREGRPRQHQHDRDEERHPVIGPAPEDDEADRDPERRQDGQQRDAKCGGRSGERNVVEHNGAIPVDDSRHGDEVLVDARAQAMLPEVIHQDGGDEQPNREARQHHPHAPGNEEPDPMQTRLCGMR